MRTSARPAAVAEAKPAKTAKPNDAVAEVAKPAAVVKTEVAPKPAKREFAPVRKASAATGAKRGPVGRMQAGLATAVAEDKDWQEF